MILTDDDLLILKEFLKLKNEKSAWEIMKKIYPRGSNKEYMMVKRKIKRMEKEGLFFISPDNKYILIKDFVKLNNMPKISNYLSIKVNGKWEIFEI